MGTNSVQDRGHRWLGYGAAALAVLLTLSVGLTIFVGESGSFGEHYRTLLGLYSVVQDEGLSAETQPDVQAEAERLRKDEGWVAVVVSDPAGLVLAAAPPTLVGTQLPISVATWPGGVDQPWLQLWTFNQPTRLARSIGVTDESRFDVLQQDVQTTGGQETLAYIWAVVQRPVFWGLTNREWATVLSLAGLLLFFAGVLVLALWVFTDARRYGLEAPWAWGALALVTNVIGWATYLVVRSSQRRHCPNCGGILRSTFRACPYCGVQLKQACPACGQGIESGWNFCPHCTAGLN